MDFFIYLRLEIEVSCIGADGALFIKVTKYINNIKVDEKKTILLHSQHSCWCNVRVNGTWRVKCDILRR